MRTVIEAQQTFLSDGNRLEAYKQALEMLVRPGDVVLDLGSGSGVLGLLALRAGAGHVHAVDASTALEIAGQAAQTNGYGEAVTCWRHHSTRVVLPSPVDVVVADQCGPMGWEGDLLRVFGDAVTRLLRPGGTLIPYRVSTFVAPVERPDLDARQRVWGTHVAGLDYGFLRQWWAASLPTVDAGDPNSHLGPGHHCAAWDLASRPNPAEPVQTTVEWTMDRAATISGFEVWFVADLAPGVSITNGPGSHMLINRPRRFLALAQPVAVRDGDRVALNLLLRPQGPVVSWRGAILRAGDATVNFAHSNAASLIVPRSRHSATT